MFPPNTTRRAGLIGACALAAVLGAVGITDEGDASLHGDQARTLMNGAFVLDVIRDWPLSSVDEAIRYAHEYYARYPALSLGHHPPLLAAAIAPAYAVSGVSIAAARVVTTLALVAGVWLLYTLLEGPAGALRASLAAALYASSPLLVVLSRSVFAEPLALALILAAACALQRFIATGSGRALALFVGMAALSLYAKQLALFVFPAYAVALVAGLGVRRVLRRDVVLAGVALVVLAVPMAVLTLKMSPDNVQAAMNAASNHGPGAVPIRFDDIYDALASQLSGVVLALAGAGVIWSLLRRDRRGLLAAGCAASVLAAAVMVAPYDLARYSIYAVPALCVLAASVAGRGAHRFTRAATIAAVVAALAVQAYAAGQKRLTRAGGYEAAARYVLAEDPGPTVLFSAAVDTGFFAFFVRKHDAARRLVVLRSDKMLTTSRMDMLAVEDRIGRREEIYDLLRRFGTRFVVVEERPTEAGVLQWLSEELRTARFAERRRIRIDTTDHRLRGVDLVIYEFLERHDADPSAVLSMHLPLVGQWVTVRLADLTAPPRR